MESTMPATLTARLHRVLRTAAALLIAVSLQGQTVTIKLGTLAPDGSTWHKLLQEMGERWSSASGGKVKLRIYAGGVAGSEGDMVRKLRIGQLNAAALSVVGLHDIESSPQALAAPGLIADEEEWNRVFAEVAPRWEKRLLDKGFVAMAWGDTGWVYLFTRKEVRSPGQMKGLKVFAWAGDPAAVEAWRAAGFQPVVLSSTDILPSLSTGMIDGFTNTTILAFTARLYEQAKFMYGARWGRLPAGTIVAKETWDRVPQELQPKLLAIAREIGAKVNAEVGRLQREALEEMKKNGLKEVPLADADRAAWQRMQEQSWSSFRGGVTSAEAFDEVKAIRDRYRAGRK
jgi:TRAP-type C4-dicarboxylate transport system substrate-binding protein